MFTGIIETLGTIQEIKTTGNVHITVDSSITTENRPKRCTMEFV
jgi:riboflavin synthase alpha subunit